MGSSEPDRRRKRPNHFPRETFVKLFSSSKVVPPWKTGRPSMWPAYMGPFYFDFHLGIVNGKTWQEIGARGRSQVGSEAGWRLLVLAH